MREMRDSGNRGVARLRHEEQRRKVKLDKRQGRQMTTKIKQEVRNNN